MKDGAAIVKTSLGKTGFMVTRMGLGLAALGRPGYINLGHAADLQQRYDKHKMEENCHRMLDFAWQQGIRYFDAARSYGLAEAFLSAWLNSRHISPDQVVVGSKWGYTYTADWRVQADIHEIKDHSLAVLHRQWRESYDLLGPWLKLYQIHSATMDSGALHDRRLLNALADIKSENIAVGLSLSGPEQGHTLQQALAIEIDGRPLFDVVQATWNMLEMSAGKVLQQVHQRGLGVIIKEGVANGRLTHRNNEPAFVHKKERLLKISSEHNGSMDSLALAFILKEPWVDIVLSGAGTVQQLRSNLLALKMKNIPDIDISERPDKYWEKRSQLPWN